MGVRGRPARRRRRIAKTVRLEDFLWKGLWSLAKRHGVSLNETVERMVTRSLRAQQGSRRSES